MRNIFFVFDLAIMLVLSAAAPRNISRARRFGGPMGGSGGGGGPFHGPGSMAGYMGGGGIGPSMGGPNAHGQGSAMFQPSGLSCIRHDIVCPKWCLVEDENGCRSCPCGPAGGMSAMAGGPSGGPMSMLSGASGGAVPGAVSGAVSGGAGAGTAGTTSGGSHGGGVSSGSHAVGGTFSGGGSTTNSGGVVSGGGGGGGATTSSSSSYSSSGGSSSSHTVYTYEKPVKECAATLLCASTCTSGYTLGAHTSSGCRTCSCSTHHEVSTTTIHYITQTVQPPTRECTGTSHCMKSCTNGYTLSNTDHHGCPMCACQSTYTPPIEIAVEPPPIDTYSVGPPEELYELTCGATSCNAGCSVGYKCGRDGCPTCECIHPSVVGMTTLQVYVERPVQCLRPLSCPSSCEIGYRCDTHGCPTCECVVRYTQTHHYSVQTCTHTLTCASTCTHGYELIRSGSGSCDKCVCKQPVVYAVQRPQPPKYQVVRCPSTSSCSAKCPHGYNIVRYENACPECKCKRAPLYYTLTSGSSGCETGCENTGSHTVYLTGGSSSGSTGSSYYVTGGNVGSSYSNGGTGSYVISSNGGVGHGISSGGSVGTYIIAGDSMSGARDYFSSGAEECPSLPPDCDPLCIKYDTPHCRKCLCETSYSRYG